MLRYQSLSPATSTRSGHSILGPNCNTHVCNCCSLQYMFDGNILASLCVDLEMHAQQENLNLRCLARRHDCAFIVRSTHPKRVMHIMARCLRDRVPRRSRIYAVKASLGGSMLLQFKFFLTLLHIRQYKINNRVCWRAALPFRSSRLCLS